MNMNIQRFLAVLVIFGGLASHAFAFDAQPLSDEVAKKSFEINWEDFKARCADPDSFDNQRAPKEIRLQCTSVEREFVPDAPGVLELDSGRQIVTTLLSDKFSVSASQNPLVTQPKTVSCLRYKEVEKSMTLERAMSCVEVLSMKGEPHEYCGSLLNHAKGSNPKLIDVRETGNSVDPCLSVKQKGKP